MGISPNTTPNYDLNVDTLAKNFAVFSALASLVIAVLVAFYLSAFLSDFDSSFFWLMDYSDIPKLAIEAVAIQFHSFAFLVEGGGVFYAYFYKADFLGIKRLIKNQSVLIAIILAMFIGAAFFFQHRVDMGELFWLLCSVFIDPMKLIMVFLVFIGVREIQNRNYLKGIQTILNAIGVIALFGLYYAHELRAASPGDLQIVVKSDPALLSPQVNNARVALSLGKFILAFSGGELVAIPEDSILRMGHIVRGRAVLLRKYINRAAKAD